MPEALPFIGPIASGIGALGGLFGNNNAPAAPPPTYMPQNLSGADTGAFGGTQNLGQYNTAGQTLPYAQNTFQNLYNNPYASPYQTMANYNAGVGQGVGGAQTMGGLNLIGAGNSLLPWQQQILQTGFDPMLSQYNTLQQQNTDQTRAAEAARGLGTSPYGAGIENRSNIDFNQRWQDALLGRQNTAAQGAGYLGNSAGNQINLGQNVSTLGLQTLNNAAALPYSTANAIGGNQFNALAGYNTQGITAAQIPQQQIQDYLQYLGAGNQAAGVANQGYANQLTAQKQGFDQSQTLGKNLGSSLSGLGTAFRNSGFGGGGGSNPFNITGSLY